jgi:hypothetical protein
VPIRRFDYIPCSMYCKNKWSKSANSCYKACQRAHGAILDPCAVLPIFLRLPFLYPHLHLCLLYRPSSDATLLATISAAKSMHRVCTSPELFADARVQHQYKCMDVALPPTDPEVFQ